MAGWKEVLDFCLGIAYHGLMNFTDANRIADEIARGDNCAACGGRWGPDDATGGRTLNHRGDCSYIAFVDSYDAEGDPS